MLKDEIQHITSTRRELKNFGFLVGGIFLALGVWFAYSGHHSWQPVTTIGTALVVCGVMFPRMLRYIYLAWMTVGLSLGWFMTRAILFILFVVVFVPLGSVMRLFGKQFLDVQFRPRKAVKTYWHYREVKRSTRERLEQQF